MALYLYEGGNESMCNEETTVLYTWVEMRECWGCLKHIQITGFGRAGVECGAVEDAPPEKDSQRLCPEGGPVKKQEFDPKIHWCNCFWCGKPLEEHEVIRKTHERKGKTVSFARICKECDDKHDVDRLEMRIAKRLKKLNKGE